MVMSPRSHGISFGDYLVVVSVLSCDAIVIVVHGSIIITTQRIVS